MTKSINKVVNQLTRLLIKRAKMCQIKNWMDKVKPIKKLMVLSFYQIKDLILKFLTHFYRNSENYKKVNGRFSIKMVKSKGLKRYLLICRSSSMIF